MNKFLLKSLLFILPLIIIVIFITPPAEEFYKNFYLDYAIREKIETLIVNINDIDLLIGGDSRANFQINPNVIKIETGLKGVNIATSSGDLVSLYKALKYYDFLEVKNITIIISTSIFQVNDGLVERDYISDDCILEMTLLERLILFRRNLKDLLLFYMRMFRYGFFEILLPQCEKNGFQRNNDENEGFYPVKGQLDEGNIENININKNHPWYRDLNIGNIRWRVFRKSLLKLSRAKCDVIIYNPPSSPVWKKATKGNIIDLAEQEFSNMLRIETNKYRNIYFIDFYSMENNELTDDMYYDIQHLNEDGAVIFTKLLVKQLQLIQLKKKTQNWKYMNSVFSNTP